jgi:hypothetical protein
MGTPHLISLTSRLAFMVLLRLAIDSFTHSGLAAESSTAGRCYLISPQSIEQDRLDTVLLPDGERSSGYGE